MNHTNAFIIVADDDADDRAIIKEAFEANEFSGTVSFVSDGQELLEKLSSHIPHIILLDLNMPKIDGRTALKTIRSVEKYRKIPVIILSTSASDHDINSCYYLGCNCYIIKPGSFKALTNAMQSVTNYWLGLCQLPTLN